MMTRRIVLFICTSILLLSTILSMYIMTSVSGIEELTEPVYVEIADYYDNRKAAVTVTADDWYASTTQSFEDMSTMLVGKHIFYTGAVITAWDPDWNQIQRWLDQGYLEVASHSRNHPRLPYDSYDSEIIGSKLDILGHLTLPTVFSFSGNEYVYSWIEPYGDSDSKVRQKLGEYKYLTDRKVNGDNEWATWDSENGLFDRIGYSVKMQSSEGGVDSATILNNKFDSVYSAGGIYHLMTHPQDANWKPGQYADLHTSHISNRNDVWYVNFGLLYLYHWVDTQNVTQVTSTGSLQDKVFKITISSTDRQNYGAKYPVTYVFEFPPSWTNAYVTYRFRETDPWITMETKNPSDLFNGINAARFDFSNHKAYVSIGFDDTSNDVYLQILPQDSEPTANFTASPTSGLEPLTVTFTDTSTSYDGITSWEWNFSDGETSTEQNPIHTYTSAGLYTVSLTVLDADGDNSAETKSDYIVVGDSVPTASFTYSPPNPLEGDLITFDASGSTGYDEPLSYRWDFGDGTDGEGVSPNHTYKQNGDYLVTITVTDADGSTDSPVHTIAVADKDPMPDFNASPTSGTEPLQVNFEDASTSYDGIIGWTWDFGDGRSSTDQNPTHIYLVDDTYTVVLTVVEGDRDSAVKTKEACITATDTSPSANFTASQTSKALTVGFTSTSTSYDELVFWAWNFGDGQTSTEQNPTHKFPDDGTFTVSLTVTDADGSTGTIAKQVSVLNVAPTADFEIVSSQKQTVDEDITFIDQSSDPDGSIVSRFWDLGDGTNSTAQNVTHRYYTQGTFTVNLTVTDDNSETGTISKSVTIYDVVPPVTVDDYDGLWHTSDFTINLSGTDDLSGVQIIYYIINDGPVMNVQTHGQPRISVEGRNKLEYWGVDFYENEETHHVIQDIKLDKTSRARARAMWIVGGIVLAIGTAIVGTILWSNLNKTPKLKKRKARA